MRVVRFHPAFYHAFSLMLAVKRDYNANIMDILGPYGNIDPNQLLFRTHLILQPSGAVAITIKERIVCYLPQKEAKRYRKRLKALEVSIKVGECLAVIRTSLIDRKQVYYLYLDLEILDEEAHIEYSTKEGNF